MATWRGLLLAVLLWSSAAAAAPLPILFVHGDGGSSAFWETVIWRFESNGYDPALLTALDFSHPQARSADHVAEVNRSSSSDQLAELSAAIDRVLSESGQKQLILVGSSRGGYAIRNYVRNSGASKVALAVLCGTPNHGVFALPFKWDNEYNGLGPFLRALNHPFETDSAVRFVTLRSDHLDKFAQPTGRYLGFPFIPTLVSSDGPALKGAENIILPGLDHRELGAHQRAFAEIYKAVTGEEPQSLEIKAEAAPNLSGIVSGYENGAPTNLPLAGAVLDIYSVDPATGEWNGALYHKVTGEDGTWGPLKTSPELALEITVQAEGYPTTHFFRTPFPRSFRYVQLRLEPEAAHPGHSVILQRPRGYLGRGRDQVAIDGQFPDAIPEGVPSVWEVEQSLPDGPPRAVTLRVNDERLTVRSASSALTDRVIGEMHF